MCSRVLLAGMTFLSSRRMNKSMKASYLFLCISFFVAGMSPLALGQDYIPIFSRDYSSRLSVEIDPVTFLFRGHSLHIRYQPMFSEHLLIGMGTYAMDLPDVFIDGNPDNRERGWNARIRSAYFLYGELYAKEANNGWFIGEQVGFQTFKVSNNQEAGGSASFNTVLGMTYAGYSWHPYKGSLYIKPWIGLGIAGKIDGVNRVGSMVYDIGPLFPFFTFHAGYTF